MLAFFRWFIMSSKDPEKLGLTIKGIAMLAVVFGVDQSVVTEGSDALTHVIVALGVVASSLISLYGFCRKIYLTVHS